MEKCWNNKNEWIWRLILKCEGLLGLTIKESVEGNMYRGRPCIRGKSWMTCWDVIRTKKLKLNRWATDKRVELLHIYLWINREEEEKRL